MQLGKTDREWSGGVLQRMGKLKEREDKGEKDGSQWYSQGVTWHRSNLEGSSLGGRGGMRVVLGPGWSSQGSGVAGGPSP